MLAAIVKRAPAQSLCHLLAYVQIFLSREFGGATRGKSSGVSQECELSKMIFHHGLGKVYRLKKAKGIGRSIPLSQNSDTHSPSLHLELAVSLVLNRRVEMFLFV